MNRCLRCSKECGTTAFCHTCQSSLLHRFKQKEGTNETVPLFTQTSPPHAREHQSGSPIRTLRNSRIISPQDDTCENALQARALVLRNQWRLQAIEEPPSVTSCGDEQVRIEEQKQIRDHSALLLARIRWMRVAFVILSLLAIVSLIVDGTLVLSVLKRQQAGISNGSGAFPVLTLTPAVVYPGQVVRVHLSNFAATSRVQLTRDVAESMRMDTTSPLVQMGATGEADVHILVEDS